MEKVHVDVTLLLRGKQRLYAVPTGEFLRYAEYCTRRVNRLRQLLRKNPMTAAGMTGPKFDLSATNCQTPEHIQIVVLTADGVWARYRHLKMTAEKPERRAYALRRLRKCQKWWQLAHDCAHEFCDEQTQLEVDAFQTFARASLEMELGHWEKALTAFNEVLSVFRGIGEASEDLTLRGFCSDIAEDVLPLIDFCKFNLGDTEVTTVGAERAGEAKKVFSLKATAKVKQLTELSWRGKVVPIVHDGLKQKMAAVADCIELVRRADASSLDVFDRLIAEAHGARQLLHTVQQKSDSDELRTMDEYLRWNSVIATVERSRAILGTYETPAQKAEFAGRTCARLADLRKQFQDDPAMEALEAIWKTVKLMNIAETRPGPEALGLFDRAKSQCELAVKVISDNELEDPPGIGEWAKSLMESVRKLRVLAIARCNGVEDGRMKRVDASFLDDLDSFAPCPKLVEVPPVPRLVTPKPAIFNLAEDYLEYPSLKDKTNKKAWFKFW